MSRRRKPKKRVIKADSIYRSQLASMIINHILLKGKKTLARRIFYKSMDIISRVRKINPIKVLRKAIHNITPKIEMKSRRIRGTVRRVPKQVDKARSSSLALRNLIVCARERPGKNMAVKLKNEIKAAYKYSGGAMKIKEETYRIAYSNKSFYLRKNFKRKSKYKYKYKFKSKFKFKFKYKCKN